MDGDDYKALFSIIGMIVLIVLVFFGIVFSGTGFTTPEKVFKACSDKGSWQYEQQSIKCTIENK